MRIGLEIGFKTVSVAIYEHGVPRLLSSFPCNAAYQDDQTTWYFGEEAGFYRDQSSFRYVPSIQEAIMHYGLNSTQVPVLPLLMQNFFNYVKQVIASDGDHPVQGVAVVFPQMTAMAGICKLITSAWKWNGVDDVLFVPNVSAILLAYAVQTMDQQELSKTQEETVHLMVCNAMSEHFQYDVFEMITNTHAVKYRDYDNVTPHCMAKIRNNFVEFVHEQFRSTDTPLHDRDYGKLEKECVRQMALFNQPSTDKVTIRLVKQDRVVTVTRSQYDGIVMPHIDMIERQLVAKLSRIGVMDSERMHILGFVDILLVGENSRMLPLRNVLEKLQMKPLNKSVSSYVDDAEAFGAAIASYLTGANIGMKQQLLYRLQEGRVLDLNKVLKAVLPSQERASCTVERPVKDVLVNDHPTTTVSGTLYMGYVAEAVAVKDFNMTLCTKEVRNYKFHFIQLASKMQNERVYMEMIIGKNVRMFLNKNRQGQPFLRIRSSCVRGAAGCWSDMFFLADQADDQQRTMTDYELRYKEMLTAVPAEVQEPYLPKSDLVAFVALVSDQLESKKSAIACEPLHPSIVNFYKTGRGKGALLVQQCQEVVGNGLPKESSFTIEGFRCHFDNSSKVLGKQDIVVIEVSSTVFVTLRFPNVDARNHFIRLSF